MYTVAEIIDIADVSIYLAANDVAKGSLFGRRLDPRLPKMLAMERDAVGWWYDLDPDDSTLRNTANYLYALCGKYAGKAAGIVGAGSGGGSVSVTSPSSSSGVRELIRITGANFADATNWNGNNNDGVTILPTDKLQIFWNGIRYLVENVEWTRTSQGINILMSGFDATTTNLTDEFYIDISNNTTASATVIGGGSLNTTYSPVGGETSFVLAGLIGKNVSAVIYGTNYTVIYSGTPTATEVKFTSSTGTFEWGVALVAGPQQVLIFYS